jgi:hypothetical protein
MDKLREWWLWHVTIPIGAIRLLVDDYHNEIEPILNQEKRDKVSANS